MDIDQVTVDKEFDRMRVMATVTDILDLGYGGIEADYVPDEEAQERGNELRDFLVDATSSGCGCIDGRCVLHTLAGNESKTGPKLAGGRAITTFYALELENYFQDDSSAFMHFGRTIDILERKGLPVKLHTDSSTHQNIERAFELFAHELDAVQTIDDFIQKVEEADFGKLLDGDKKKLKTACGMADGFAGAFYNMSRLPLDVKVEGTEDQYRKETPEEIEQRLEFIRDTTIFFHEGANPKEAAEIFERHVENATRLHEAGFFDDFQSIKLALILEKVLRNQGSEESALDRMEVLEDDGQGVHGHHEWAAVGVSKELRGKVLDNTAYARETSMQVFAFELWAADENATAFATGPEVVVQQKALYQAQITAQAAGYFGLGDGSQRGILLAA